MEQARELLARMTPEEKVGQLALVTFIGPEAAPGTPDANQIYDLIINYHIGGVVLQMTNDNFVALDQTIPIVQSLTDQLQRNKYLAAQSAQRIPGSDQTFTPAYIPLFIGISQGGDGYPYDQLLSGLTPLPSQMSLGATWQPELARQVGMVLGNELSILGFNLLIGPALDVLEAPYSESWGDLGVRSFGGDPFWVGEMGRAYIAGVHQGSNNQIAVLPKHFPGFGGSDRLPEDEVATVRKSLEQLKQIELAPFFAVTGNAPDQESTADGLLVSHIRIQGFQGNIRDKTKPVSFDPMAFSQLVNQPALKKWRDEGGIMVSDNLGSRAVRRFYDPTGQTFSGRTVALDAFLAGNDILYLGNFVSSNDPDAYTTIIKTLAAFSLKYREDAAFAQRVDESVLRILALKYRIYGGSFSLSKSLPSPGRNNQLGISGSVTFEVARQAATLISPALPELEDAIPGLNDRIVFINDTRIYQQCSRCPQQQVFPINGLELAVVRLYSPQAGGQVTPRNLISYSYQNLQEMLDAGVGQLQIENDLKAARWIVFNMLDMNPNYPSSLALRHFLDQRPDLVQDKFVIVFALNAPYYLDATEISKLTAYYGLFSRSSYFIDVAARLLFQELRPTGDLPVSVLEIGYDLNTITFPDPNQIIPLTLDTPQTELEQGTPTPEATPTPINFKIGDLVSVRTGVIVDHNGRTVPDGIIARFILSRSGETGFLQMVESQTDKGVARGILRIDSPGNLEIRVESDPAKRSDVLQIAIPPEIVTPTELPPSTVTPTETLAPTPTATPSPTPEPTPTQEPVILPSVNFVDWFTSLLVAGGIAFGIFWVSKMVWKLQWGVRSGLLAAIGGLVAYSYLALELPGSTSLLSRAGLWGVILLVFAGAVIGSGSALVWWQVGNHKK